MSEEIALRAIIPTMSQIIGLACMVTPDKEKPAMCGFVILLEVMEVVASELHPECHQRNRRHPRSCVG